MQGSGHPPCPAAVPSVPGRDERVVGVADVDLYVPRLNFVFGEADVVSRTAIVSLTRLRQEYYGLAPDEPLFLERATKEMVHELGHTFGLYHCHHFECVMRSSTYVEEIDIKNVHQRHHLWWIMFVMVCLRLRD
jgi:archaemetzincin